MNKTPSKIIILGAGIIGVTIAGKLAGRGLNVTLIDREQPGLGVSFGNAGHFATEQVFPLANPGVLGDIAKMIIDRKGPLALKPSYMLEFLPWACRFMWASRPSAFRHGIKATKSLNEPALLCWQNFLAELDLKHLIQCKGSLEIFQTQKAFTKSKKLANRFIEQGVTTEIWSEDQVRQHIPALTGQVKGALFFPETAHTPNPHRLVTEIFDKAVKHGVNFIQDNIMNVKHLQDGRLELKGDKEKYVTEKLILSSGVFSGEIMRSLGKHIPIEAERGYHYMLPAPDIDVDLPLTFHERKFILTPMEHGIRLAGTVEFAGIKTPPTPHRARMLYHFAKLSFPGLKKENATEWSGFRPTLPDYLPVIDLRDNIIYAYGHNHLGLTQAAITAALVQDLVTGNSPRVNLTPFNAHRF